ncbi:endoplasmic reticulum junction formation protein lunapark-B-like [Tubulanus polymorphus]|uniref:endoplasmic reticulum junction formation protein lunapark-B-like n=1 Tax=Tubulanus polymorphus TaxID=672921 RepID=UPI003DA3D3EB
MGSIISRWRKKPTTVEQLESLEKEIKSYEKSRAQNLQSQKTIVGYLIVWSIVLYIIAALVFYFGYFPTNWTERILHSLPLIIFPGLIWLLKRFLHWYFIQRTSRTDGKLRDLRTKKKDILEEVMEKEVYKKAKEILEKFDPEQFKKIEKPISTPLSDRLRTPGLGSDVRHRTPGGSPPGSIPHTGTPRLPRPPVTNQRHIFPPSASMQQKNGFPNSQQPGSPAAALYGPPGPPLPRPIIPRDRTNVDRLVEYLVGDGPQNRYALICRQCLSHNGMALKEEFEYMSFRCCYCYTINPARKNRPHAPRLEPSIIQQQLYDAEGSTESDSGSAPGSPDIEIPNDIFPDEEENADTVADSTTTSVESERNSIEQNASEKSPRDKKSD